MARLFLIAFFIFLSPHLSSALEGQQSYNLDGNGIALHGYDPVSYYAGEPVKGKKDHTFMQGEVRYLFANRKNLSTFKNNPEKYRFAYGGWCAWAMLEGEKVDVDPERFKEVNGIIYLFYNSFFTDTFQKWNKLAAESSDSALIEKADGHWQQLAKQE